MPYNPPSYNDINFKMLPIDYAAPSASAIDFVMDSPAFTEQDHAGCWLPDADSVNQQFLAADFCVQGGRTEGALGSRLTYSTDSGDEALDPVPWIPAYGFPTEVGGTPLVKITTVYSRQNLDKDTGAMAIMIIPHSSGNCLGDFLSYNGTSFVLTDSEGNTCTVASDITSEVPVGVILDSSESLMTLNVAGVTDESTYSGSITEINIEINPAADGSEAVKARNIRSWSGGTYGERLEAVEEYIGPYDPSGSAFVTIWTTPSASSTIQIPLQNTTDVTIDWGDGNIEDFTTTLPSHTYVDAGTYTVSITGTSSRFAQLGYTGAAYMTEVVQLGDLGWTNFLSGFEQCAGLTTFNAYPCVTENVTTMSKMFNTRTSITSMELTGLDTSGCLDMSYMFNSCSGLTVPPDVTGFDTSSVTNMLSMFSNMTGMTSPPDVSGFVLTGNVNIQYIFYYSSSWTTEPDVSSWDVSGIADFGDMYTNCLGLTSITAPASWVTSSLTNFDNMFRSCNNLTELDVTGWDITGITVGTNFATYTTLDTSEYDAILAAWAAQAGSITGTPTVGFGNSKFTDQTSRDALTTAGWTINDGGLDA